MISTENYLLTYWFCFSQNLVAFGFASQKKSILSTLENCFDLIFRCLFAKPQMQL